MAILPDGPMDPASAPRWSGPRRYAAFGREFWHGMTRPHGKALGYARLSRGLGQIGADTILICNGAGRVVFENPAAGRMNAMLVDLVRANDRSRFKAFWNRVMTDAATRRIDLHLNSAADKWSKVEITATDLRHDPNIQGVILSVHHAQPSQIYYDVLTGLPNQGLFRDRLEQALIRARRCNASVGLLVVNIDDFAMMNDSLGFEAGDRLLIKAAGRLRSCVRAEDTVARLQDDQFAVVLDALSHEDEALPVAKAIAEQFRRPVPVWEREITLTVSIGIALSDPAYPRADSVLRNADAALDRAKRDGKARYVVFQSVMRADASCSPNLETELLNAIDTDQLRVHYQPIVDMASGCIVELEALVRWQHPSRGLIPPADFLRAAEETGMIIQLGKWVMQAACLQLADWQRRFPSVPPWTLSVNLSPRQFHRPFLMADVIEALLESGLPASSLRLGISEATIMADIAAASRILAECKELGLLITVDNFGSGGASMSDLRRLPIDTIKIESSLVSRLDGDAKAAEAVHRIIALARSLDVKVAGECIETEDQAALLKLWGCQQGQGFHFGKPLDATQTGLLMATMSNQARQLAPAAVQSTRAPQQR